MARDELRIDVTADTSKAESELRGLDHLADQIDLDPKVDTTGIDKASSSFGEMADSAGLLPGPLAAAAGMLTGPAGIAAGAVAAGAGLYQLATSAADSAIDAEALRSAVGGTVEETSRLLAATKSVGLDYNDLLELISESNRAMSDNADAASRLGVNLQGTPIERFQQLVDAVYAIQDPLERARTASKFFGEEGSKQLPKLIAQYGDLTSAMDAVPELAVMSDEDVANARDFKQAMAGLTAQLTALGAELGKTLIPTLTKIAEGATIAAEGGSSVAESFGIATTSLSGLFHGDWDQFISGIDESEAAAAELADTSTDAATAIGTELVGGMAAAFDATTDLVDIMGEEAAATEEARAANEKLRDDLFGAADAALAASRAHSDLTDMVAELGKKGSVTRQDVERLNDQVFEYADAQVVAAGTTRDTTAGAKLYKDALNGAAAMLGDQMNPELQTYIDKANAVPDTAITDIHGDLDASEFNEADRLADQLDQRQVTVQVHANIAAAQRAIAGLATSMFGARTTAAATTRNQYRNGTG